MGQDVQQLEEVLRAIAAAKISLTPQNIELWQAHLSGDYAGLSADITAHYRNGGVLTDILCTELHEKYFPYQKAEKILRSRVLALLKNVNDKIYETSVSLEEDASSDSLDRLAEKARFQKVLQELSCLAQSLRQENEALTTLTKDARQTITSLRRLKNTSNSNVHFDVQTGIGSRIGFDQSLTDWTYEAGKAQRKLSIIIIKMNKNWLSVLDENVTSDVMFKAANILNDNIKGSDWLHRYDETSFSIVLPVTRLAAADILGEKIRVAFSAAALIPQTLNGHPDTDHIEVQQSCFIGVSTYQPSEMPTDFVERAVHCAAFAENRQLKTVICEDSPELNDFRHVG